MNKYILITFVVVLVLTLATGIYVFLNSQEDEEKLEADSFANCIELGFPVMESYPRQCMDDFENLFVEEIEIEEDVEKPERTFYGSSSNFPCEVNDECVVSGCNKEICMNKSEEPMSSICILPEDPLPTDLGYSCGCFENQCQWSK